MRIIKRFSKTSIGQKSIGFLFYILTSLIFHSIRWKPLIEDEKSNITKSKEQYIFCCWHNRLFLGPHLLPKSKIINALQSSHSDGMITSVAFKYLGMKVILGSSMKGGMQAFRKMINSIKRGENIAITPDGPKGPKEEVKVGILKLSQITGVPIVPLVWTTNNYKVINSWDGFIIPFPFSKGVYSFGKPIYIKKKNNEIELEILRKQVEDEINHLTKMVNDKIYNEAF